MWYLGTNICKELLFHHLKGCFTLRTDNICPPEGWCPSTSTHITSSQYINPNILSSFDVLLTVHLGIFILVLTNLMHTICFTISLFNASTCFEHHVLIVRRSKLYYTASGIITPIGGRHVHRTATYSCDDTRCCIIQF